MFKYVKYTKVTDEFTTHEFRGGDELVKVNHFDVDVVSIEGASADVDALIAKGEAVINCVEVTQAEFKVLVTDSSQLKRIREVVATEIAKKYSIADEFGMAKRAVDDTKRVAYEAYVAECISIGKAIKTKIGY